MIKEKAEISIRADVTSVWSVLTDFTRWPAWNTAVTRMSYAGPLAAGTVFKWKAGLNITSTIIEVQPPLLIRWMGKMIGVSAVHEWRLAPQGDVTGVTTVEDWRGTLPKLLPGYCRETLRKSLKDGLEKLKSACEQSQ